MKVTAQSEDKHTIVELLARSFEDNRSVNFIIRQDKSKARRIRFLMEYSFDVCSLFGKVWLSDDRTGCALVLYPHLKRITLKSLWLDIKLAFRCIGLGGIRKAMKREAMVKAKQPKVNRAYLWFIGVDPMYADCGTGSKLLHEVIADAQSKNLSLYLETSTLKNLPWYERFGFQIYDELEIGYTLFFLKRISK